jgi:hypothetical protein
VETTRAAGSALPTRSRRAEAQEAQRRHGEHEHRQPVAPQEPQRGRRGDELGGEVEQEDAPDRQPGDVEGAGPARRQVGVGELEGGQQGEDHPEERHRRIRALGLAGEPALEAGLVLLGPSRTAGGRAQIRRSARAAGSAQRTRGEIRHGRGR